MKLDDIPEPIRTGMQIDELIFGNAFCLKSKDGTYERIDPMKVKLNPHTKEFDICDCEINRNLDDKSVQDAKEKAESIGHIIHEYCETSNHFKATIETYWDIQKAASEKRFEPIQQWIDKVVEEKSKRVNDALAQGADWICFRSECKNNKSTTDVTIISQAFKTKVEDATKWDSIVDLNQIRAKISKSISIGVKEGDKSK